MYLIAIGLVLFVAILAPASASADATSLLSRQSATAGGAAADENSGIPSASTDGRYVAFESDADNLSPFDEDFRNIFVRDTQTDTTILVSRQSAVEGNDAADDISGSPAISADGRYVAFTSLANNLSTASDDLVANVFVRDLETNTTTLVSRAAAAATSSSSFPSISADGRYVAFESGADNLVSGENEAVINMFVRDTVGGTTTLVSRTNGGVGADGDSYDSSVSSDGRYVAFSSRADNLSTLDDNGVFNIFVRDTVANTTTLVSRQDTAGGTAADGDSGNASISANGHLVAFHSVADNLSATDNDAFASVFLRDTTASTTALVSRQSAADGGAAGDNESAQPSISADGRFVAFQSYANNLSAVDVDATGDIFRRDTATDTTALVSRQASADGGAAGDDESSQPTISPDGRYVGFVSKANNLSALIDPTFDNIFLRDTFVPDPPAPPAADTTPPDVDVSGAGKGKLGKPVKIEVACDEACSVLAKGAVKTKGSSGGKRAQGLKLKPASAELGPGETTVLKLKPSKRTARKLKQAAKGKATISVDAIDAAGNSAKAMTKLKLR